MEISDEIQEKLGLLKSFFLSEIIIYSVPGDYDFADYLKFDHQIEESLGNPDEIWDFNEDILVYRKFFLENGDSYSQVLLTLKESKDNPLLIVLNFVTRFDELASRFCRGRLVKASTRH